MKNRLYLVFVFFFCIACLNNTNYRFNELKKEIITLNKNNLHDILRKYNIKSPYELKFNETGYYYPVALFFYKKFGYNDWVEYQLNMAVKTKSIFNIEALNFNAEHLIKEKNFEKLKDFLKDNENTLIENNLSFYLNFINDAPLSSYENFTDNTELFPLIYHIIKNKKFELNAEKNEKLIEYIIKSKIYKNKKSEFYANINNIIKWSRSYYIKLLYSYYINDKKNFIKICEAIIKHDQKLSYEKVDFIRELSINLGLRKDFYRTMKSYYKNNIHLTHFYCLDALTFESFKNQIIIFKNIPYANEKNDINYYFKYRVLLNTIQNLNENWLLELSKFIYNYPEKYYTKMLIDELFIKAVTQNKTDILIKNFSRFDVNVLPPQQRTIFLYQMYLIDKKNELNLKNLINKEYPWSYASLRINNGTGNIFSNKNAISDNMEIDVSKQNSYNKVRYLLEFNLLEEALSINTYALSSDEKNGINSLFHDYYTAGEDYFTALRYAYKIAEIDNPNFYNIRNTDVLKKLYPLHFKEQILKYSKEYNIEPALAFAVMREESNFKKDIASHMSAVGLMQIIPSTGKFIAQKLKLKTYDLKNPDDNIKMGIYYLSFIKSYYTDYSLILASYNAGKGRVNTWSSIYKNYPKEVMYELIPIYETRHYIRKVMGSYYIYRYLLDNEKIN